MPPSRTSRRSPDRPPTWFERAGCWAVGVYAFALYFTVATLVTVMNGDVLRMLQSGVLAALLVTLGIWLARRNVQKVDGGPRTSLPPEPPPRAPSRPRNSGTRTTRPATRR